MSEVYDWGWQKSEPPLVSKWAEGFTIEEKDLMAWPLRTLPPKQHYRYQVPAGPITTQEGENMPETDHGNPDDMEAAALRLATLAQEIRAFDALEPQGDEPVITWKHTFHEGEKEYTFVAVKLGDDWYVTGDRYGSVTRKWRQFREAEFARELLEGNFLLVTEWSRVA